MTILHLAFCCSSDVFVNIASQDQERCVWNATQSLVAFLLARRYTFSARLVVLAISIAAILLKADLSFPVETSCASPWNPFSLAFNILRLPLLDQNFKLNLCQKF
jgi:hypothetical protein